MDFKIDSNYLIDCFEKIINTPSPVGYSVKLKPVLESLASELGKTMTYDNRDTAYITLEGEDNSKTVLIGAHADTIGYTVSSIDSNGMLCIRKLGGISVPSSEGESVKVITRDGREYTGIIICKSHSTHVFEDAHTLERKPENMRILLDADVKCKEDVRKLGIQHGDLCALEPYFEYTEGGYIKSRFIDDKGAVACAFTMLKYLVQNNLKPKYRTILAFPYWEELGMGGSYVPEGVSEYVAIDIGLIGPDLDGSERSVSICAGDMVAPYHYELTSRLTEYAKKINCPYSLDVFYRYSTDANAAAKAGNNLKNAAFGMAVYCSHGKERTHIDGLVNTVKLMLAYTLDI